MPKKRENHSSLHFLLFVKEEIALVALYKRAKKAIHTTKRANSSFALKKKQVIRTKNQRANSQP